MPDKATKPSIPAWQRAQPQAPSNTEDPVYSQPEEAQTTSSEPVTTLDAAISPSDDTPAPPTNADSPTTSPPAEALEEPAALAKDDFTDFKQQYKPPRQELTVQPTQQQTSSVPPIITYPEFLVDAHKPPPLITPARIVSGIYVAGAAAALAYGAGKWIINPMVESLIGARHDFFSHSQSKIDDFNERLSKIVTKIPETKKDPTAPSPLDADEVSSEVSDPTELYHRDMGTQTSPMPTRRSSDASSETTPKDSVSGHTDRLTTLKSHLQDLVDGSEKVGRSHKERQEDVDKLRHYLDQLLYSSSTMNVWYNDEDAIAGKKKGKGDDAIEDLKKDIRGVKGVLLSAKRFPTYSMTHS